MHMAVAYKRACFGQFAQADGSDILDMQDLAFSFWTPQIACFSVRQWLPQQQQTTLGTNGYIKVKKDGYKLDNDQKILTITGK